MDQTESFVFSFPGSPCSLSPLSFSQDVPKDYRHVSLTGVKQRFEDEAYQHISKEQVLNLYFYQVFFLSRKSVLFLYNFYNLLNLIIDLNSWPCQGDGL